MAQPIGKPIQSTTKIFPSGEKNYRQLKCLLHDYSIHIHTVNTYTHSNRRCFIGSYRRQRSPDVEPPSVDRDNRTVMCMQLSARVSNRDLEDFFSRAGVVSLSLLLSTLLPFLLAEFFLCTLPFLPGS